MEWTKENTIQFIEVYRTYDIIWDRKHPDHYHKLRKQDVWEEIAKLVGKSVDECKKKMEYLLAALRREKMKIKKSRGTGTVATEVYKSSWFAFESMRFLWDKNKPKSTLSTLSKAMTSQVDRLQDMIEKRELHTSLETLPEENCKNLNTSAATNSPDPPIPTSSSRRKRLRTLEDQRLDKAFEMLRSSATPVDDSYHFGNLVASKLRAFDDHTRCAIESDILNIFIRANKGHYNTVNVLPEHAL